jgi:hypothetical protein
VEQSSTSTISRTNGNDTAMTLANISSIVFISLKQGITIEIFISMNSRTITGKAPTYQ